MDYELVVKSMLVAATAREDIAAMDPSAPLLGHIAELDSMAIVTFFTAMEEEYGVFIDDDEVSAELFETLGSLTEFTEQKLAS